MGINVTSGTKGGFHPLRSWRKPKPVRPFGLSSVPYDPTTGKFLALGPDVAYNAWTAMNLGCVAVDSTSRLTMPDTSMLRKGIALRFTFEIDGTTFYAVVDDISDDTHIDVRGAPLSSDLVSLEYGIPEKTEQVDIFIAGEGFAATSADLLDTVMFATFRWDLPPAYLVGFSGELKTADSTVNPKVNVEIAGNKVSTNDSSNGIQPTASRVENPLVAINVANYKVEYKDSIEIPCTVKAGTEDAANLTLSCVFVWE